MKSDDSGCSRKEQSVVCILLFIISSSLLTHSLYFYTEIDGVFNLYNINALCIFFFSIILFKDIYFTVKNTIILRNIINNPVYVNCNINIYKPSRRDFNLTIFYLICITFLISVGISTINALPSVINIFTTTSNDNTNKPNVRLLLKTTYMLIVTIIYICVIINVTIRLISSMSDILLILLHNYSHGNPLFKNAFLNGFKDKNICYICNNNIHEFGFECECGKCFHKECISTYISLHTGKCFCNRKLTLINTA